MLQLFNDEWHKLYVGVESNVAELFVDCVRVGSVVDGRFGRLGSLDTDSDVLLGKKYDGQSAAVSYFISLTTSR